MIPTVAIVAKTSPFIGAVTLGQKLCGNSCANVSILPGYPFTDTPDAGMHILVSSWDNGSLAARIALEVSAYLWQGRGGFVVDMLSLGAMQDEMRRLVQDPSRKAMCFADIADNPGGGGTANTTYALEAILAIEARDVAIGPFWDPNAAAKAHAAGIGAEFDLVLNEGFEDLFAKPFAVRACVTGLSDGGFDARSGPAKGVHISQLQCAALAIGGTTLVVTSRRLQALAVEQFEIVGVDISKLRAVIVKSRGHYQASFAEFFDRSHMREIDTPGWMSPKLERLSYSNIPRPLFPMDQDTTWNGDLTYVKQCRGDRIA
jgi:microcystin degradation protein MlrC